MTNRRSFLTVVALSSSMFALPSLAQTPGKSVQRPSSALEDATQLSFADTFKRRGGDTNAFVASATASVKLLAAMYEDRRQTGVNATEQAYLLGHPEDIRASQTTVDSVRPAQVKMSAFGVNATAEQLVRHTIMTQDDKEAGIKALKSKGVDGINKLLLHSVAKQLMGAVNLANTVNYHPTTDMAHFQNVQCDFDRFDCQVIKYGALFGSITSNPGGWLLAAVAIYCC